MASSGVARSAAASPARPRGSFCALAGRNSVPEVDSYRQANDVEPTPGPEAGAPLFSPLELIVIGIGRRDPTTFVTQGSKLARLRSLLFGIEAPRPFANPRLEALRLLTVAFRRRGRDPHAEIAVALAAGVTPRQIEHLSPRR